MRKSFVRVMAVMVLGVVALVGIKAFADPVEPASVQIACLRDTGSSSPVTNLTFYQGTTLSLTNSVMYTSETADTNFLQNLDGCSIAVVAGQPGVTNNVTAVGLVIVTNEGTWSAEFIIPPYNPCYIEVTVSNTSIFTYPRYRITTQEPLPTP